MVRPTRGLGFKELVRREARSVRKLTPWVLGTLLLTALLWRSDLSATGGMFQSQPATPTIAPTTPVPTPTATAQVPPTLTATTEPPVPTPTVTGEVPPATATPVPPPATPTATPAGAVTATLVPTNIPSPTPIPTETPVTPTATPLAPTVTNTPIPSESDEGQRYAQEDSSLLFDWSVLFDSVALGLSYLWLCCGVLVLLGIPTFFIVLWLAGRRRQQGEE